MARVILVSANKVGSTEYATPKQRLLGSKYVNQVKVNPSDSEQTNVYLDNPLASETIEIVVEENEDVVTAAINKKNTSNDKRTVSVTVKEIVGVREEGSFTAYATELNIDDIVDVYESGAESGAVVDAVTFTGSGLDDATSGGTYTGEEVKEYVVEIDATGTPDTFQWSNDGGVTFEATGVAITGAAQTLEDGVQITFAATTGHTLNDQWAFAATPSVTADSVVRLYDSSKSSLVQYKVDETLSALKTACNG